MKLCKRSRNRQFSDCPPTPNASFQTVISAFLEEHKICAYTKSQRSLAVLNILINVLFLDEVLQDVKNQRKMDYQQTTEQ